MKYTVVLLALVAAVSAQYKTGQYKPIIKPYSASPIRYQSPVTITPYYPSSTFAPYVPSTIAPVKVEYKYGSDAVVLKSGSDASPDGAFNYFYETSNGIAAQEQGTPRLVDGDKAAVVVQGSFSWTAPEGKSVVITYVADENGYQPSGDALPTPPPLPAQIARALEYITKSGLKK